MAPFASPHKSSLEEGLTEVMDTQHTIHYSPTLANFQPISIFESLNSVLHSTKSTDVSNNGSQTGSGHGIQNTPTGQGESEEESDLAVLLALFIPLAATVTAIFIIALFVRRMRRAESLQNVHHPRNDVNEIEMAPRKKQSASGTSSTSEIYSVSSTCTQYQESNGSNRSQSTKSHLPLGKANSSASIYYNSYLIHDNDHHPISQQWSCPVSGVTHSPSGRVVPPWPLESGSLHYLGSIYGLNKFQQQLYQHASLEALSSMSWNGLYSRQCSAQSSSNQSEVEFSSDESCTTNSSSDSTTKKSANKKFRRVLSAINFPRKIRQYQADRKRFNIYTIPTETREQLKHIYVY